MVLFAVRGSSSFFRLFPNVFASESARLPCAAAERPLKLERKASFDCPHNTGLLLEQEVVVTEVFVNKLLAVTNDAGPCDVMGLLLEQELFVTEVFVNRLLAVANDAGPCDVASFECDLNPAFAERNEERKVSVNDVD